MILLQYYYAMTFQLSFLFSFIFNGIFSSFFYEFHSVFECAPVYFIVLMNCQTCWFTLKKNTLKTVLFIVKKQLFYIYNQAIINMPFNLKKKAHIFLEKF